MLVHIFEHIFSKKSYTRNTTQKSDINKKIYFAIINPQENGTLLSCNRMSLTNPSLKFTIPTAGSPHEGLLNKTVSTA